VPKQIAAFTIPRTSHVDVHCHASHTHHCVTTNNTDKQSLRHFVRTHTSQSLTETSLDSVHAPVMAVLLISASLTRMCRQPNRDCNQNTAGQHVGYQCTKHSLNVLVNQCFPNWVVPSFGVGNGRGRCAPPRALFTYLRLITYY
jgi:hypothetical protein